MSFHLIIDFIPKNYNIAWQWLLQSVSRCYQSVSELSTVVQKLSEKFKKNLSYLCSCHLNFLILIPVFISVFPLQVYLQRSQNPKSSSEIDQACIFDIHFVCFLFGLGPEKNSEKIFYTGSVISSHQLSAATLLACATFFILQSSIVITSFSFLKPTSALCFLSS